MSERQAQQIEQVRGLIVQYKGELVASLPSHLKEKGQGWMSSALSAVRRDPNLLKAVMDNPGTFVNALSDAAQKGLMPGTPEYYLTPRPKKGGTMEVLGITGYQGYVELMYRAGAVASVIVETVHENDKFEYVLGKHDRPVHEVNWFEERGQVKLAYAYAIMASGGAVSRVVIVNQKRIDRAKEASPTARSTYSPWGKDEDAMWLKTAARDLAKWVPTSAEYIREKLRAEKEVEGEVVHKAAAPPPAAEPTGQEQEPAADPATGEIQDLGERENEPAYPESWGGPGDDA